MRRRLAPLLHLVMAGLFTLAGLDAVVFRSGWYWRFVEPNSTAGASVGAELATARYREPGRKNVLMLGDSRVGEGFSMRLADAAAGRDDLHFVNAAIPGTGPRVWHYQLRAVDPDATRFAAIVLMVEFDVTQRQQDLDDFSLDTNHVLPWLRLADLIDYPASFGDGDERARARRAILFPVQALHDDVLAFAMAPRARVAAATTDRAAWLTAVGQYPGRESALPDLPIDPARGLPVEWGPREAELKPLLDGYFRDIHREAPSGRQARNDDYLRTWLGRIAARYGGTGIPVVVYAVPRGPWHRALRPRMQVAAAITELASRGRIHALPGDAFSELEQPQYFFDALHMNRAGRERFSRLLAERVAPLIR